ncbi:MAG: sulfite exporter TauE/SafE family protein [Thermoleophilia bacterium]|nr:sulfite exporter TauE/SafE family protein [Thermoleophilia bacterium]
MNDVYLWLLPAVFVVAALYASVGHGGGSGYLALLALTGVVDPASMSTTALLLNVVVAGIGTWTFARGGHLRWSVTWPFIVASIPLAFVGGLVDVDPVVYGALLAISLGAAALRIAQTARVHGADDVVLSSLASEVSTSRGGVATLRAPTRLEARPLRLRVAVPTGGAIGLVSGIVGVGGGIFLSPIMLLRRWGTARQIAATSAVFVLVNSFAGLIGRAASGSLAVDGLAPLLLAATAGGVIGARLGAHHVDGVRLRYALAAVLAIAAVKSLLLVVPA